MTLIPDTEVRRERLSYEDREFLCAAIADVVNASVRYVPEHRPIQDAVVRFFAWLNVAGIPGVGLIHAAAGRYLDTIEDFHRLNSSSKRGAA